MTVVVYTCSRYFKEWKHKIRTENNLIVGPTLENS